MRREERAAVMERKEKKNEFNVECLRKRSRELGQLAYFAKPLRTCSVSFYHSRTYKNLCKQNEVAFSAYVHSGVYYCSLQRLHGSLCRLSTMSSTREYYFFVI